MSSAAQLAVVLVEPSGPLNVGSVARLCANFDVGELRLVAPRCDHLGEEARRMVWRWAVAAMCMMQVMMYATPTYLTQPGDISDEALHLLQ